MSNIAIVEDAMLAAIRQALLINDKSLVREVAVVPGEWTDQTLRKMLQTAPAVFVSFNGVVPIPSETLNVEARFDVFVLTGYPTEEQRRRGHKDQIGAYQILERIAPVLHALPVTAIGSLLVKRVINLFSEARYDMGGTVYGIECSINMAFEVVDDSSLVGFELFSVDYDIEPFSSKEHQEQMSQENYNDSNPDAEDEITLEQ